MFFDAIVELRDNLNATPKRIPSERHIGTPFTTGKRCGHFSASISISSRSLPSSSPFFRVA
jgi:hypothetical protein